MIPWIEAYRALQASGVPFPVEGPPDPVAPQAPSIPSPNFNPVDLSQSPFYGGMIGRGGGGRAPLMRVGM